MKQYEINIRKGDTLNIVGSRITFEGKTALIAKSGETGNETYNFRDQSGRPRSPGKRITSGRFLGEENSAWDKGRSAESGFCSRREYWLCSARPCSPYSFLHDRFSVTSAGLSCVSLPSKAADDGFP